MAEQPIFPGTIKNNGVAFTSTDTTTAKAIVTAGSGGARIDAISVTTDDTTAVDLNVYYYDGTTDFLIGTINIPIGAGNDEGTTPVISLLNSTIFPFLKEDLSIFLEATDSIRVSCQATMTAAKTLDIFVQYGDF